MAQSSRVASPARKARVRGKRPQQHQTKLQIVGQILAVIGFIIPFFIDIPGLGEPGERMLSIFIAAIILWVTEAIPLVATAVFVILAEILLVSDKALLPVAKDAPAYQDFFSALANPVVMLFLGGFLIADGAAKYGLDRGIAAVFLKPFKGSPRATVLGIMLVTGVLSMFMSNTATTATMFAVLTPVIASLPPGKARTGVALSIPVAANIGGIGTPVGTPPNAIALAALSQRGIDVSFFDWTLAATPYMLIMLFLAWALIAFTMIPKDAVIEVGLDAHFGTSKNEIIFYVTAGATILLWMTEVFHGVSSYIVGFVPVVVLLGASVMTGKDLKALDWPVLWLVGGGIALGDGVGATGLDKWLVGSIDWASLPGVALFLGLALFALALSNVISNSATANLLVPLGLSLATGSLADSAVQIGVVLAIACSLAMCLPISTPPNAIAYSSGEVTTKSMAINGLIVGGVGVLVLVFLIPAYWSLIGFIG
ncbi:SLC13 family permease [Nanchangia anserum]|uniref:SLC13/DASS family transporter n=1 Tax=Nanchangia anserum TaxID=2692125 RepID=A0A8I0KTR1_9ACTO|nr:DASS family sodium-coupled anion symporter [Nanchangia anserum]MBD3688868.1 SLC13/DASS family transporter [Nanchangia anserum]